VKLEKKINLTIIYKKKIKRMMTKLKKIKYHKFGFNNEIKNKLKFYKMIKNIN
jgi:hypothetical protein